MKIKDAINALEEKGLIKTIRDGNTWTLTLAKKAERNRSVIRIRRDWVIAVKTCKGNGLDWSAALKVWLFVLGNTQELITSSQIAEALYLSKSTVSKARQYLFYDRDSGRCLGQVSLSRFAHHGNRVDRSIIVCSRRRNLCAFLRQIKDSLLSEAKIHTF